jgi:hypothetical protein
MVTGNNSCDQRAVSCSRRRRRYGRVFLANARGGIAASGQWARSVIAWCIVWPILFTFALLASTGFAATNLADTIMVRASRNTPTVELAQRLADTLTRSREDECRRRGDRCRDLEALERQALADLKAERSKVAEGADPQANKAAGLIAWLTAGGIKPGAEDIANFRLTLLTVLPQLGGVLLLVGRR